MPQTPSRSVAVKRRSPYDRVARRNISVPEGSSAMAPKTSDYSVPANADALRALIGQPGYVGLAPAIPLVEDNPFLGPRPVLTTIENDEELDDDLLLLGDTTLLHIEAHDNFSQMDTPADTAAYLLYLSKHHVSLEDYSTFVQPLCLDADKGKVLRDRVERRVSQAQRLAGKFFLNGVKKARLRFEKVDEFDVAPSAMLRAIWAAVFEDAPFKITEEMLGVCAGTIDLKNIFFHPDQEGVRRKWRNAFKTIFVAGCMGICRKCPGTINQIDRFNMKDWYKHWKDVTVSVSFKEAYPWWSYANIPVIKLGNARNRRVRQGEAEDMSEDVVAMEADDL